METDVVPIPYILKMCFRFCCLLLSCAPINYRCISDRGPALCVFAVGSAVGLYFLRRSQKMPDIFSDCDFAADASVHLAPYYVAVGVVGLQEHQLCYRAFHGAVVSAYHSGLFQLASVVVARHLHAS